MSAIRRFTNSELDIPDACCAKLGEKPKFYFGPSETVYHCSDSSSSRKYVLPADELKKLLDSEENPCLDKKSTDWITLGCGFEGRITKGHALELHRKYTEEIFRLPDFETIELMEYVRSSNMSELNKNISGEESDFDPYLGLRNSKGELPPIESSSFLSRVSSAFRSYFQ